MTKTTTNLRTYVKSDKLEEILYSHKNSFVIKKSIVVRLDKLLILNNVE